MIFFFISLFQYYPRAFAHDSHTDYIVTPSRNTDLQIDVTGEHGVTIAIDTKCFEQDLQGGIPIKIISNSDDITFENNEKIILWHSTVDMIENQTVSNAPLIYMQLTPEPNSANKKTTLRISREVDISKFAAIASFLPEMIPTLLSSRASLSPQSTVFYNALMRWNYKVIKNDILDSSRKLILSNLFKDKQSLLAQCSTDFIQSFLLFEIANYGIPKKTMFKRSKISAFRSYMMVDPFKHLMQCMSHTVSYILMDIQKNQTPDNFQYIKNMNKQSIEGLSKLMIGYSFNTFAYEAGDFFKQMKKTIGFSNAINDIKLQADIEKSLIKAAQFTIQSGYELFFTEELKYYNIDKNLSIPISYVIGAIEILIRLQEDQKISNQERTRQILSCIYRAEAMGFSFIKLSLFPELSDKQSIVLGLSVPAILYGFFNVDKASLPLPVYSIYKGIISGIISYFLSPVMQKYSMIAAQKIQKPVLDYFDSAPRSWSEYIFAEDIRYRIDVIIE